MTAESVPGTLQQLVEKMQREYKQSEMDIAVALANEDGAVSTDELAAQTGYTERTVRKRVGTLEEQLRGPPLLQRTEDDAPFLHPELARAIRESDADE